MVVPLNRRIPHKRLACYGSPYSSLRNGGRSSHKSERIRTAGSPARGRSLERTIHCSRQSCLRRFAVPAVRNAFIDSSITRTAHRKTSDNLAVTTDHLRPPMRHASFQSISLQAHCDCDAQVCFSCMISCSVGRLADLRKPKAGRHDLQIEVQTGQSLSWPLKPRLGRPCHTRLDHPSRGTSGVILMQRRRSRFLSRLFRCGMYRGSIRSLENRFSLRPFK